MAANVRLGSISLDCADSDALADFWAATLGGDVAFRSDRFAAVRLDGLWMSAVAIDDYRPPTWPSDETPKQIHLDLAVQDLAEGERFVLELGATRCDTQPAPERYLVFLDPAGHPFCLSTQIPD